MLSMAINIRIRELRQARNLTQAELGEMVGCSGVHVSLIERGKKNLNNNWLERFARVFDVPPTSLISEPGPDDASTFLREYRALSDQDRIRVADFVSALRRSGGSAQ